MSASGIYAREVGAGIVGHADLTLGSRVEPVLMASMRRRNARHPHITAWDADASRATRPIARLPD